MWDKKSIDFHDISTIVHKLLNKFSIADLKSVPTVNQIFEYGLDLSLNGSLLGSFGKLNNKILKLSEVSQDVFYAELDWKEISEAIRQEDSIS